MEKDPAGNEIRKARRARRLPPDAACVICGENRPVTLEMHHPCGHANAPDLEAPYCKNCHAVHTEAHRDAGVNLSHSPERTLLERLEASLRGLVEFFRSLADQFERWAEFLESLVEALDARLPAWRGWPEVQP